MSTVFQKVRDISILAILLTAASVLVVHAWRDPPPNPPSGNVDKPFTVSADYEVKDGIIPLPGCPTSLEACKGIIMVNDLEVRNVITGGTWGKWASEFVLDVPDTSVFRGATVRAVKGYGTAFCDPGAVLIGCSGARIGDDYLAFPRPQPPWEGPRLNVAPACNDSNCNYKGTLPRQTGVNPAGAGCETQTSGNQTWPSGGPPLVYAYCLFLGRIP